MSHYLLEIASTSSQERTTVNIPKSASFHVLEDLTQDAQYRVTLTPVWIRDDFKSDLTGNVLTFSIPQEEAGTKFIFFFFYHRKYDKI